ncbi:MAG: decarboxylating 6-phosphogluconate dehydrogenase [Acidimicrobiales bacterium]|nr:MAG: decarboxylating 6-phosphogluconate dehydrogenase [Acidimicrobiales bacterium]
MKLGLVGLGKMGGNMRERLTRAGHEVVGYDRDSTLSDVSDLSELVVRLGEQDRVVWVMVPAGAPTHSVVNQLAGLLTSGDIVIDGGNSRFTDDAVNSALLDQRGIGYLDVGVSGGVWGLDQGYALMVGGAAEHVAAVQPVFDALCPAEGGFVHAGGVGAGHFSKMVHNGIEYGLMQAYAEGYELLSASELVVDVPGVLNSWREGTVVRSWLLDLLVKALEEDPGLHAIAGHVEDSGEGRWTVEEAISHSVPTPVIAAALFARFASRQADSPTMKAVSALRHQFGGHAVTAAQPR